MEAPTYQIPGAQSCPETSGKFDIFPVFFPVSRENQTGERFAADSKHHHKVFIINKMTELVKVLAHLPAYSRKSSTERDERNFSRAGNPIWITKFLCSRKRQCPFREDRGICILARIEKTEPDGAAELISLYLLRNSDVPFESTDCLHPIQ